MLQILNIEEEYSDTLSSYNNVHGYEDRSKLRNKNSFHDIEAINSLIDFDEVTEIYIKYLIDNILETSLNEIENDYPIPRVDSLRKDTNVMEEKKSTEEYLNEALAEFQDDEDIGLVSDIDARGFISYCESTYNMKTRTFLKWFEENGNEGNVDMKLWAMFARNLEIGYEEE